MLCDSWVRNADAEASGPAPIPYAKTCGLLAAGGPARDWDCLLTLTPEQRRLRAEIAAHALWAKTADPSAHTAPARTAFLERFERQVDPDGILPPEERARRAEHARKAWFKRLALAISRARAARSAGRSEVPLSGITDEGGARQSQGGGRDAV